MVCRPARGTALPCVLRLGTYCSRQLGRVCAIRQLALSRGSLPGLRWRSVLCGFVHRGCGRTGSGRNALPSRRRSFQSVFSSTIATFAVVFLGCCPSYYNGQPHSREGIQQGLQPLCWNNLSKTIWRMNSYARYACKTVRPARFSAHHGQDGGTGDHYPARYCS